MNFVVLAADSLGVRSLAVWIPDLPGGGLLIDPGAALAPKRFGLPPHTREEAALAAATDLLSYHSGRADRIAITHFHHDHFVPFRKQQWIVSGPELAAELYQGKTVFLRDMDGPLNPRQQSRARALRAELKRLGVLIEVADNRDCGDIRFSPPFRHGDERSPGGWVVMVCVKTTTTCLVHMSDTQLLNPEALTWALQRRPAIVITSGPPLYLPQLGSEQISVAQQHLLRLVERVPHVVLDHHVRRGGDIGGFLDSATDLAAAKGHRLESGAASLGQEDRLLEANRKRLYGRD